MHSVLSYISLGSNLDNPQQQITRAIDAIADLSKTRIVKQASLYRTPPWGGVTQDDFINTMLAIQTELSPFDLLQELKAIEIKQGRTKRIYLGPRVIDCDIILYGDTQLVTEDLAIPHQSMHDRAFVLIPLNEIAPNLVFPDGRTLQSSLLSPEIIEQGKKIRPLAMHN